MAETIPPLIIRTPGEVSQSSPVHPVATPAGKAVKWVDFLAYQVAPLMKALEPLYESDFNAFWWQHQELWSRTGAKEAVREKFMKARILFAMLESGGLWGLQFIIRHKGFHSTRVLLQEMADNAAGPSGFCRPDLFEADCDEIEFLFAEMGTNLGLKDIEVRLVQDNHVNVYVPLGYGLELRMDPTGVSGDDKNPLWNLPGNLYIPKGKIPEDYYKNSLAPYNRSLPVRARELANRKLTVTVAQRLLARMEPRTAEDCYLEVPKEWARFVRGYREGRACFEKYLRPYSVAEVVPDMKPVPRAAESAYLECIVSWGDSPLERMGRAANYVVWGSCAPAPVSMNIPGCDLLTMGFQQAVEWQKGESLNLRERMVVLKKNNLGMIEFPGANATLEDWLDWINKASSDNPQWVRSAAILVDILEHHPAVPLPE